MSIHQDLGNNVACYDPLDWWRDFFKNDLSISIGVYNSITGAAKKAMWNTLLDINLPSAGDDEKHNMGLI